MMETTTNERSAPIRNVEAHVAGLSPDVWYLILQNVPDRGDRASLCRVCKGLYPLATRILYRKITIGPPFVDWATYWLTKIHDGEYKSDSTKWVESLALVRRLAAGPMCSRGETLSAVREIDISSFGEDCEDEELGSDLQHKFEEELPGFVSVLPNLQRVRIFSAAPAFEALFRALRRHSNRPEIHLLGEDGSRPVFRPMPGVVAIQARANPWGDTPEKPNTKVADIQRLFFACPDLKSFSLSVANDYGGCMRPLQHFDSIPTFQFPLGEDPTFPPLESLSLSGYDMDTDREWPYWRDGLDWSRLKALTLGPHPQKPKGPTMADLLRHFEGHATALRSLTVLAWCWEGDETCEPLTSFLTSFDTLEELTVKRHFVPVEKLARHSRLKRLCLHCMELPREQQQQQQQQQQEQGNASHRPTFSAADLTLLDQICPDLETLEIDISRQTSGEWPREIIEVVASSFSNLQHLTLHCETGLDFDWSRSQETPFLPVLDETLVRAFAEPFFASRGRSKSKMQRLTLKTGEKLRRYPQWHPGYRYREEKWTREFDAWLVGTDDAGVKVERQNVDASLLREW